MRPADPVSAVPAIGDLCREAGLTATARQVEALDRYLVLLRRWNATYNLSAVRDPDGMLRQHIADCVAIVPSVLAGVGSAARILDVGSGAGLPGVVLAILIPTADVTCIDAVGKKSAFIRQVAGTLQLANLHAVHGRVERWRAPPYPLIVSRAFSSLSDFARLTGTLLAPEGVWLAMKGRVPDDEIAVAAAEQVEVFHVEHIDVPGLDAERCLVWMRPQWSGAGHCAPDGALRPGMG